MAATTAERHRPSPVGWAARVAVAAGIAWLVLLFPLTQDAVRVNIYTEAVIFGIIGLSLNVLIGYAGQISLGHQAFVGIGAFTSAYMVTEQGQTFWVAVLVAMVVGGLQGLVLGAVSLRVTGLYFALVTLAYGIMAEDSLFNIKSLTGGTAGQPAPKPDGFESDWRYYYLCLVFLAAVLWVDRRLMKTKGGRALLALRENPRVAATFGTNVKGYTLLAFVLAGVLAGLGGSLFAHNSRTVVNSQFDFQLALVFVIMTVVGGLRSRVGVVLGAAFFSLIDYLFAELEFLSDGVDAIPGLPDLPAEYVPVVIGPLLLLINLTTRPGGIGEAIAPLQRWLAGQRFSLHGTDSGEVQVTDVRA
jgi:branched-chain amino acid transport system permease protein